MSWYLIAETSTGRILVEGWYDADTEKDARSKMWNALTHDQRDMVSCIDCVDTRHHGV